MGLVSPLGNDPAEFWERLANGESGISEINGFSTDKLPSRIAGQVKNFDPASLFGRKAARRMDRCTQLTVAAAGAALDEAGLGRHAGRPRGLDERIGVVIGTGLSCLATFEAEAEVIGNKGPRRVSPFLASMMLPNMPAGQVSIDFGVLGPSRGISTACATGADCIGEGAALIKRGLVDSVLAGGADSGITPLVMSAFSSARTLSHRNDDPALASRPFDQDRDGFVMAEGAAVIALEGLDHARNRGANILAELAGYGTSSDAYHITAPDESGNGIARAIRMALDDAGWNEEEVDYVNAHGTSTQLNDRVETVALKQAFGARAYDIPISSTKSMTGHTLGAAGAVEFIASVMSLRNRFLHPTINLDTPDPSCDLDYIPNTGRAVAAKRAISNSLAFGGHNACLAIQRWDD